MAHNLNHGSSVATYFLPALCSDKTENFVSFMFTEIIENPPKDESITARAVEKFTKSNFHHLMIPYSHMVEKFLNNSDYRALIVYTLSSIKKDWVRFYKNQKIYDIISIFGSNETSGPTFINRISDVNFEETKYKTIDNFYNINLRDGQHLEVGMPIYNTTISTNDTFKLVDGAYYHTGRSDLYRINGQVVDVQYYNKLAADVNATCVIDTFKDSLYLAFWENTDFEKKVSHINSLITIKSRNLHKINKFALLNKNNFLSGIKLDMELLRDYFRKFVD